MKNGKIKNITCKLKKGWQKLRNIYKISILLFLEHSNFVYGFYFSPSPFYKFYLYTPNFAIRASCNTLETLRCAFSAS